MASNSRNETDDDIQLIEFLENKTCQEIMALVNGPTVQITPTHPHKSMPNLKTKQPSTKKQPPLKKKNRIQTEIRINCGPEKENVHPMLDVIIKPIYI